MTSDGILAFSDPHIGPGFYRDKADDFGEVGGWAEAYLIQVCQQAKIDKLTTVSVGDLIEAIQFYFDFVIDSRKEFFRELFSLLDYIVAGNHDAILLAPRVQEHIKDMLGLKKLPKIVKTLKLGDVWIEHGHDHDPHIRDWPRMWKVVTKVVGVLERRWPDIDVKGEKFLSWLGGTGRHSDSNVPYHGPVADLAHSYGCTKAIIGHSHNHAEVPTPIYIPGAGSAFVDVYNTGTRTGGRTDSVRILR